MTRSEFRENVFRVLFRYDFFDRDEFRAQAELYMEEYPQKEEDSERWPKLKAEDCEAILARAEEIMNRINEVDIEIASKMVGWTIDRVGKAELTILRIALYEMLYDDSIDKAVSIDEAVNLAKKYGDEKAPAFVNGVLAKFTA